MQKNCFKCGETKPITEFYKHPMMADGYLGKCKSCTKLDVSSRARILKDDPHWLAMERERCRDKQERYRIMGLAAPATNTAREKWRLRNLDKIKAHKIANKAVKSGLIVKPKACTECGAGPVRLEKHHDDYSRPLAVRWLCPKCHGKTKWKS